MRRNARYNSAVICNPSSALTLTDFGNIPAGSAIRSRFRVTSVTAIVPVKIETLNSQLLELLSFVTFCLAEGSLVVTFAISFSE